MARDYSYNIEIDFKISDKEVVLLDDYVSYPLSKTYKDKFYITNKKINITAKRSKGVALESVFYNYNSALNRQITKAISYYYCTLGEANIIDSISITSFIKSKKINYIHYKKSNIKQIAKTGSDFSNLNKLKKK